VYPEHAILCPRPLHHPAEEGYPAGLASALAAFYERAGRAGVRVAAAYAGHADGNFGVTGTYTKASPDELRLAHARLFFDRCGCADDPGVPPNLLRRAIPTSGHRVDFVGPNATPGNGGADCGSRTGSEHREQRTNQIRLVRK
jgi:hypothetical protein